MFGKLREAAKNPFFFNGSSIKALTPPPLGWRNLPSKKSKRKVHFSLMTLPLKNNLPKGLGLNKIYYRKFHLPLVGVIENWVFPAIVFLKNYTLICSQNVNILKLTVYRSWDTFYTDFMLNGALLKVSTYINNLFLYSK